MRIGDIDLTTPVLLAPMSGITDWPFRRLVAGFGVGMVVSEMIASRELLRRTRASLRRADHDSGATPCAVQLAGAEPAVMADAARLATDMGAPVIDINFGCPARKVVGKQAGSALMRQPALARQIVAAVVAATDRPVTVKIRLGWDMEQRNAPSFARQCATEGAQMITVHGRTREQRFSGRANWDYIGEVVAAVTVPVIANGDIDSPAAALTCLGRSGAAGVMIGRACRGRPWLPAAVGATLTGRPTPATPPDLNRQAVLRRHLDDMVNYYGLEAGMRIARKHFGWYAAGAPGAAAFRRIVNNATAPAPLFAALDRFFTPRPAT